ncbi:MAG: EAL domain-containing protein [Acidimicrobiales bacterium]
MVVDPQETALTATVTGLIERAPESGGSSDWNGGAPPDVRGVRDLDDALRAVEAGSVAAIVLMVPTGDRHVERRVRDARTVSTEVPLIVVCDGAAEVRGSLIAWGADDVLDRGCFAEGFLQSLGNEVRRSRRHSLEHLVSAHLLIDALFRDIGYALIDTSGTVVLTGLQSSEHWSGGLIGLRASDLVVGRDRVRFEEALRLAERFPSVARKVEVEVVSPTPGRRWLEISMVDIGRVSAVGGVVATHRDQGQGVPDAAVVECLAEGVVVYGPDGIITVWNDAASRLLGVPATEAVGAGVEALIGHVAPPTPVLPGEEVPDRWIDEVQMVLPDGGEYLIERNFTRVRGSRGNLLETVLVVASVTGRHDAEVIAQRFSAVLDSSSEAILSKTAQGVITTWNSAAERMYGYTSEEVIGRHVAMLVPEDRRGELESILAQVARGSAVERLETVRRRKDMSEVRVVLSVSPLFDGDGTVVGSIAVARDITLQRAAEEESELAELRFEGSFRRSTFGMAMADLVGRLASVNPAFCDLLGRPAGEIVGHMMFDFAESDGRLVSQAEVPSIRDGVDSYSDERRYRRPDGITVWLQANVTVIRGSEGEPLYLMIQALDITARKRMEYELEHRALHDDLTGLPNRALLNDRLDQALAVARRAGHQVGMVFLDVDGFKNVNDALGHGAGDRLLVELGHRLRSTIRPVDTVARFGGDEFAILCADVTMESMELLAARIRGAMNERIDVGGHDVAVHASLGITLSEPESSAQSILSEADAAMYRAKELGRDRSAIFDDALRTRAAEYLESEKALRLAIARRDLVAYYQPIVGLNDGRPIGVEALVRWVRDDGTIVPPDRIIPLAESTGLIVRLGELILLESVRTVSTWNSMSSAEEQLVVSVNISARQLSEPSLVEMVRRALEETGLEPGRLQLEITETVVMSDIEATIAKLYEIRDLGVTVSIDDFGTGYSSLAYLKQLPVDTLKIDHSFVDGVVDDPDDHSIVEAVIGLGRALGITCLAEGVESDEQLDSLARLGCDLGQGYLWARPMAATDARQWLARRFADL